jgi:hypothetical protein
MRRPAFALKHPPEEHAAIATALRIPIGRTHACGNGDHEAHMRRALFGQHHR